MCGTARNRRLTTEARRLRDKEDHKFNQEAEARKVTDKSSPEKPKARNTEPVNS